MPVAATTATPIRVLFSRRSYTRRKSTGCIRPMSTPIWHFANRSGQQQGPVTAIDLRAAFERGELDASTLVWREGFAQWLPLSQVATELGLRTNLPPPVPSAAPDGRQRVAYAPPPKRGMSRGALVAVIAGVALAVLAPVSILAAIAISSYQDYVAKAQFSESISIAESLEGSVAEHHSRVGTCPSGADLDVSGISGRYVSRVELPGGPAPCSIVLIFGDNEPVAAALRGGRVTFSGTADGWTCRSGLPNKFKPRTCQDGAN